MVVVSSRSSGVATISVLAEGNSAARLAQMAAKFLFIPAINRVNQTEKEKKKTRITTYKPEARDWYTTCKRMMI